MREARKITPKPTRIHPGAGRFLRYRADRGSAAFVSACVALVALPFLLRLGPTLAVPLWLTVFAMRVVTICLQHYHGHLRAFRTKIPNAVYGGALALCTGMPIAEWELQHNRAHHRHFREPRADVASSVDPATGRTLSHLEYVFGGSLRIVGDCFRIARDQPERAWTFRLAAGYLAVLASWVAACLWNPAVGLAWVVIPALSMRAMVWYGSYWHHLDVPRTNLYDSSVSNLDALYNRLTFNSGHHATHHEKPTLHWSLLPARTRAIRALIPDSCVYGARQADVSAPSAAAALTAERIASS